MHSELCILQFRVRQAALASSAYKHTRMHHYLSRNGLSYALAQPRRKEVVTYLTLYSGRDVTKSDDLLWAKSEIWYALNNYINIDLLRCLLLASANWRFKLWIIALWWAVISILINYRRWRFATEEGSQTAEIFVEAFRLRGKNLCRYAPCRIRTLRCFGEGKTYLNIGIYINI